MNANKKQYLVSLPVFAGSKGFNHKTILVGAKSKDDAISFVRHLKPNDNIGDIKMIEKSSLTDRIHLN